MAAALPDLAQVEIASSAALRAWLEKHHSQEASVLLVTSKKAAGATYVSREAVLDALVAYGWIDGRRYVHEDPLRTMQLIAPRKQQVWADSYKRRAAQLEADGLMQPSGRAAIAAARQAGLWDAAQDVDALVVPDALLSALRAQGAQARFEAMAPSYRRNVLRWLSAAKREATRAKRIAMIAGHTARGEKIPQL